MGSSFGFGASTNHYKDFKNARVILVEGNNPAENHPMGMKWILEAKALGAKLIVVDPRFTRTAAHADEFVAIRPGTDVAFVGGLIRLVLERGYHDADYLVRHTNARYRVHEGFYFEGGVFSGLRRKGQGGVEYDPTTWSYSLGADGEPRKAETLEETGTVFDHLRRHFDRYTPEVVEDITGVRAEQLVRVAELMGSIKPGVLMYALGATQHTIGVQQIRSYAILQLLLGNMGVAGGGVGANRGESNVQGATDMAVLWDKLPGYLPQPGQWEHSLADYRRNKGTDAYLGLVNLLRAWFADEVPLDEAYRLLPRIGKHTRYSVYELQDRMLEGEVRGLVCMGQNPAVSNADRTSVLAALASLDLLVVLDIFETETASFWKLLPDPAVCDTEVWLLPSAGFLEKPGSLTNSGRWVQGRQVVVDPPGEAHSDLWILDRLFCSLRGRAAERDRPRDRALLKARWGYQETESLAGYQAVLAEIAGWAVEPVTCGDQTLARGDPLPSSAWLRDDGTTAAGNRLYAGLFAGGEDLSRRRGDRDPEDEEGRHPEWAWSWPDNTRILYEGSPDSPPFARNAEGVARLFAAEYALEEGGALVRRSLRPVDGPLPEHYEPVEGPLSNPLHPEVPTSPLVVHPRTAESPPLGDPDEYPCILSTGFLHEMWGGGAMSRRLAPLIEAQPEAFVEISRSLGNRLGVRGGETVALETARGRVELKVVVTGRLRPIYCDGAFHEVVWAPMHYGEFGDATGAAVNAVTLDALEPNVKIHETKSCRCRVVRVGGETPWEPGPRSRIQIPGEGPREPAPPRDYSRSAMRRAEGAGESMEEDSDGVAGEVDLAEEPGAGTDAGTDADAGTELPAEDEATS